MDGKTHKCVGLCAGIIAGEIMIGNNLTIENMILGGMVITGSMMGSLIMDIDKKRTKASKKLPVLSWLVRLFTSHRGFIHDPLLWTILGYLMFQWLNHAEEKTLLIIMAIYCIGTIYNFAKYVIKKINKKLKVRLFKKKPILFIISFLLACISAYSCYLQGNVFVYVILFCSIVGFLVGISTHIFLDSLTPMGVPILGKRIHIMSLDAQTASPYIKVISILLAMGSTIFWFTTQIFSVF